MTSKKESKSKLVNSVKQSNIELIKKFSIGDKLLLDLVYAVSNNTDDSYDIGIVESYGFSDDNELLLRVRLANKKCKYEDKSNCEPSFVRVNPKENGSYIVNLARHEVNITNLTHSPA